MEKVTRELKNRGFGISKTNLRRSNNICLSDVLDSSGFWFSASNAGHETSQRQFPWVEGTEVYNATLFSGQSDSYGAGKEMCVLYHTESAKLYSDSCSDTWRILCEVPEAPNSCH